MKDTLGNVTTQTYSVANLPLVKTQPLVTNVDEHGVHTTGNPVTTCGYDVLDRLIGTRDPNGHTSASVYSVSGYELQTVLADGTIVKTCGYDALGHNVWYADGRGKIWHQYFDHCYHITQITSPSGKVQKYTYSEAGYRISDTNNAGETLRYNCDVNGNVIASWLPMGQLTTNQYDRNGQLLLKKNGDGTVKWVRDYFGRETSSIDLSGAVSTIVRDFKGQVTRRYSTGGNHGQMTPFDPHYTSSSHPNVSYFHIEAQKATPPQDITYTYVAGQTRQILDKGVGTTATQSYDTEGRVVNATLKLNQHTQLLENTQTIYDTVGKVLQSTDLNSTTMIRYDFKGNRRYVSITIKDSSGKTASKTNWWTYDAADRVLIDNGVMQSNAIVITNAQGAEFTYQHDFRATQREYNSHYNQISTSQLVYDDDGYLAISLMLAGDIGSIWYYYDKAHRTNEYVESYLKIVTTYNANGWPTYVEQYKIIDDNINTADATYDKFTETGQVLHNLMVYEGNTTDNLTSTYTAFQWLLLAQIKGYRNNDYGQSPAGQVVQQYDANGVTERVYGDDNSSNNAFYTPNQNGELMLKWINPSDMATKVRMTKYLYGVDGTAFGSFTVQYDAEANKINIEDYTTVEIASFPQSSLSQQSVTPEFVTVTAGDTFASLAQRFYGYSGYASIIAMANGYAVTDTPEVGSRLKLPNITSSINPSTASRPYQILKQLIVGTLYPHLETPQPPKEDESFFEEVVDVVVDVVIIAVAVTLAIPSNGASLWTLPALTTAVGIGLAAGAAASIVTQGLAIGVFNSQDSFSLTSMFQEAAITGAAMPFMASMTPGLSWENVKLVAKAAVSSQVTSLAIGATNSIDLGAIITQVATYAAGASLGGAVGKNFSATDTAGKYAVSAAEAVGQTAATTVVGAMTGQGTRIVETLAANYAGNVAASQTHEYFPSKKPEEPKPLTPSSSVDPANAGNSPAYFDTRGYQSTLTTASTNSSNNAVANGVNQVFNSPLTDPVSAVDAELVTPGAQQSQVSAASAPASVSVMPDSFESGIMQDMGLSPNYYGGMEQQVTLYSQGVNVSDPFRMTAYPNVSGTYIPSPVTVTPTSVSVNPANSRSSMFGSSGNVPDTFGKQSVSVSVPIDFSSVDGFVDSALDFLSGHTSIDLQVTAAYGSGFSFQEDINLQGVNFFVGQATGKGVFASASLQGTIGPEPEGFGSNTMLSYGDVFSGNTSMIITQNGLTYSAGIGTGVGFYAGSNAGYYTGRIPWSSMCPF